MFWQHHIVNATPEELLPEFMTAMEQAMDHGLFKDNAFDGASYELQGPFVTHSESHQNAGSKHNGGAAISLALDLSGLANLSIQIT